MVVLWLRFLWWVVVFWRLCFEVVVFVVVFLWWFCGCVLGCVVVCCGGGFCGGVFAVSLKIVMQHWPVLQVLLKRCLS